MSDDVLEDIRITSIPTTFHHLHLRLEPSRSDLHRLVGFGKVRGEMDFPFLDGFESVTEVHLGGTVIAPKALHPPRGRERRIWIQI